MGMNSFKVFIVDDECSIVEWLVNNVEWEVYNCEVAGCAYNAADALQDIEENPVDILITDISMPGMSGLELIKKAKEMIKDIFIIVISAYDKFEYVKIAYQYGIINYCLKPIDVNELYSCLKTIETEKNDRLMDYRNQDITVFRNSIFQRLLDGENDMSRLDEQCELAGICLEATLFQVALIDMSRLEKNRFISVVERFNRMERDGLYTFLDGHMNLVLLFIGGKGCEKETETLIKEALRRERVMYDTFLSIGKPLEDYKQIAVSYQICRDFLKAGHLFSKHMVRTEDFPYDKYSAAIKRKELQLLINESKRDNGSNMVDIMQRIVNVCRSEEEKRAEIICLMISVIKNAGTTCFCQDILEKIGYLDVQFSSENMLRWIEQYCKEISRNHDDDMYFHPYVNQALQKINNNYAQRDISLQNIAESCCVSAAYLGKLFKEQTGEFFNDYLLKVRLKAAERFLFEGKMKIGVIAENVGFSNQSYFNKIFRREYGISPAEYRRQCHEENE